jgi:hypothetical protein
MLRRGPTPIRYRASISTKVFKPGSICSTKPSTLSETDTDNAYADSNQPLADARLAGRSAITSCRKLRMGFSAIGRRRGALLRPSKVPDLPAKSPENL